LFFKGEASSSTLVKILAPHGKRKHKETTKKKKKKILEIKELTKYLSSK
jgi:hypothetical protein